MKKRFLLNALLIMTLVLLFACVKMDNDKNNITKENSYLLNNGTFEGEAEGFNDKIKVAVTIENDIIKDVKVISHIETVGIGCELKDKDGRTLINGGETPLTLIPRLIVEHQNINIDAVSGATVTSNGLSHAIANAISKAGLPIDAYSAATEVAREGFIPKKVDDDPNLTTEQKTIMNKFLGIFDYETDTTEGLYDVIVIGAGGSGLASAVSASENGAKVLVLEKNGIVGGDTLVCGAIYNAPDSELQNKMIFNDSEKNVVESKLSAKTINSDHDILKSKVKKDLDEHMMKDDNTLFDSINWFVLQTWDGGDFVAKLPLVNTLCENAYDCYEWVKKLGMQFENSIGQGAGSLWPRTHTSKMNMGTGFITTYLNYIKDHDNVEIRTNITAKELVKDSEGKVCAVRCEDRYGKKFTVDTKNGVIIATGGFSANKEMINKYNTSGKWQDLSDIPTTNRKDVSQGDGIKMATEIGASLTDMDQIQLLYLGNLVNGQLTKYPSRCVNGAEEIIMVNKEGKRFVDEGARRDVICNAVLSQSDKTCYILESGDGKKYKDINSSDWRSADGFTFDYLVENKYVYYGDTLDELCSKIGIDVNTLKQTIEKFNSSVDGEKDEFGRTAYSNKILNGPYVITPRQVSVHHTMGGLTIDTDARVLDESGNVIKGLYACGEVTGGIHGSNRLGGNAVVDTVVFGRIAGKSAALKK